MRKPIFFGIGGVLVGALLTTLVAIFVVPLARSEEGLEPGDLVIVSGKDQSDGGQRQELVNQWNELHPENKAHIEEVPIDADNQLSEMIRRAQSPAEAVDIYNLDVAWTAQFADAGYLRALDESTTDTSGFLQGPLQSCRFDGKLWALPFNTDAGLLYYRDQLVAAPGNWKAIEDETKRVLTAPHDDKLVAGYTAQLRDYEGLVVNAIEAIWQANGEVIDRDGTVMIESAEAREGLRRLADGLRSNPPVILPDARNQDEEQSRQAFAEGRVLFMRNWPVAYRHLQEVTSDDPTRQQFFNVVKLPGPSVLGGQNLAVAGKSGKPRAAQALIEFLTDARSQQILFERGGFAATRKVVYLDAEVQNQYRYAKVLLEAIENARPRPITPYYVRFAEAFRGVVVQALANGGQVPPDAKDILTRALRGE